MTLNKCPFCRSHFTGIFSRARNTPKFTAACLICGAHTQEYETPEQAAEIWRINSLERRNYNV